VLLVVVVVLFQNPNSYGYSILPLEGSVLKSLDVDQDSSLVRTDVDVVVAAAVEVAWRAGNSKTRTNSLYGVYFQCSV
jgi:hypothetical protein